MQEQYLNRDEAAAQAQYGSHHASASPDMQRAWTLARTEYVFSHHFPVFWQQLADGGEIAKAPRSSVTRILALKIAAKNRNVPLDMTPVAALASRLIDLVQQTSRAVTELTQHLAPWNGTELFAHVPQEKRISLLETLAKWALAVDSARLARYVYDAGTVTRMCADAGLPDAAAAPLRLALAQRAATHMNSGLDKYFHGLSAHSPTVPT